MTNPLPRHQTDNPDNASSHKRLTHKPFLSSDELIVLLEDNVEDYALIVTNPARQIINWSSGAEHLFGYSVEEALGRDAALLFTCEDQSRHVPEQEFQTAYESGRSSDERWHMRKDGSRFWGSGVLTALRGDNGNLRGAVKILRDRTEEKRFEEKLRAETETAHRERERAERECRRAEASAQQNAELNALLRRTMAEAHHRIKNSFQILSALLDMQQEDSKEHASFDAARLSLHIRALAAIHDLLTEEVKTADEFDYVSARGLVEKLVLLLQTTLAGRVLESEVEDIPLSIKQATSLAPLLSEMVANAIKHGRGDILVTLTQAQTTIRLEVRDHGSGFPAGFDPRSAAHTGLELIETFVRHDLRGDIRYENAPQDGAQLTVTFPVSAPLL